MTTSLVAGFDSYQVRARVYPALLTLLPLVVAAYAVTDLTPLEALAPAVVSAGGVYLLASLSRTYGLRAQDRLVKLWGGLPTTQALRHANESGTALRQRRHTRLAELVGAPLPSPDDEHMRPQEADERYELAARVLIARVRQASERFPRVHEELTHYGFRRNLYGLRSAGLLFSVMALAWMLCVWIVGHMTVPIAGAMALSLAALSLWLSVVTPAWVRQAGDLYAERLFEALEDGQLFSRPG